MQGELTIFTNLIQSKHFRFIEGENIQLTTKFLQNLKTGDIFNCHCREFIRYLKFKRCDKHFRSAFDVLLQQYNLNYVISNQILSNQTLQCYFNPKQYLFKLYRIEQLQKDFNILNRLLEKDNFKNLSWEEFIDRRANSLHKIFGKIDIKENKQKLSGSFTGGCNLILFKN